MKLSWMPRLLLRSKNRQNLSRVISRRWNATSFCFLNRSQSFLTVRRYALDKAFRWGSSSENRRGNFGGLDDSERFWVNYGFDSPLTGAFRMDTPSRKPYPSDLSDEAWALLEPLLPPPLLPWAPRRTDFRELLNAIFYVLSTGCALVRFAPRLSPGRDGPRLFPSVAPIQGIWQRIHDELRGRVREAAGKGPEPSAGCIDSQTVKATRTGGQRGYDAGKKNQRGQAAHLGGHARVGAGGSRPSGEHPGP